MSARKRRQRSYSPPWDKYEKILHCVLKNCLYHELVGTQRFAVAYDVVVRNLFIPSKATEVRLIFTLQIAQSVLGGAQGITARIFRGIPQSFLGNSETVSANVKGYFSTNFSLYILSLSLYLSLTHTHSHTHTFHGSTRVHKDSRMWNKS